MTETLLDATLVLAAWLVASAVAGFAPRARVWGVVLVTVGVLVVAAVRDVFRAPWVLDSLAQDVPWGAVALLAGWSALGRAAPVAVRRWPAVVLLAALAGDLLVAMGLALVEPDPRRRARLVLAASGASLLGPASGAAPLLLGWGGPQAVALGALLALVGFAGSAGSDPAWVERPPAPLPELGRRVAWGAGLALAAGVAAWATLLTGGAELFAERVEMLPLERTGVARWFVLAGATFLGGAGDEGFGALFVREVAARALSVRGDWALDTARAGLCVGGGLPLLVLTRSSLRVGVPLWLAQVALVCAWVAWAGAEVLP